MSAKRYLQQVQILQTKIDQRIKQIEELQRMKERSIMKDDYIDLYEIEKDATYQMLQYAKKKDEILKEIQQIEDDRYLNLLYKRYVEGKSLRRIATEMNYEYESIRRMHGYALISFESIMNAK